MATLTKGKTFGATEEVTAAKLHQLVDSGTVSGIVNADIDAAAAIVDTKLSTINTAGKVDGGALTGFANIPSGAGYIPVANLSAITTTQISASAAILGTQLETKIDDTGKISGKAFTELADIPSGAGVIPVANGGTGQATAPLAINALLPDQATANGQFLTSNGSVASWGTVTSFAQAYATDTTSTSIIVSAPTERTYVGNTYTKKKEITSNGAGTVFISFSINRSGGNYSYGRIYINDVATGTERQNATAGYVAYTETITVAYGDKIQLYVKNDDAGSSVLCKDFKIYAFLMTINTD
jgi:hypothetical protein